MTLRAIVVIKVMAMIVFMHFLHYVVYSRLLAFVYNVTYCLVVSSCRIRMS
jgi:hypothetical protein